VSARRAEHRLDKNRKLQRARFSLTHATPLLPAPTQSEGECRVGEGEPKGESTGGAASPFTRSLLEPQIGLPLLLAVFYDSWCVAMVEPPGSYLESTALTVACEMAIIFRSAGYACYACRVLSLRTPSLSSTTSSAPPPPYQERRALQTS
jgi:hypothetical protein